LAGLSGFVDLDEIYFEDRGDWVIRCDEWAGRSHRIPFPDVPPSSTLRTKPSRRIVEEVRSRQSRRGALGGRAI
jgi:hypothetical protein